MLRRMVSTDKNLRNHIESALKKRSPGIKAQARRFNQIRADLVTMAMATPVRQQYTIPLPLDVDELFNFDGSGGMWADVDGGIDVEVVPPVWMADEDIRMAIPAMLQRRRAGEEVDRVKQEMSYLADSLFRRLRVVDALIQCCKGTSCQLIEGRLWSLMPLFIKIGPYYFNYNNTNEGSCQLAQSGGVSFGLFQLHLKTGQLTLNINLLMESLLMVMIWERILMRVSLLMMH